MVIFHSYISLSEGKYGNMAAFLTCLKPCEWDRLSVGDLKFGIKNSAISNWEILQQNQQYHTIPYQQYQIGRLENHKYISKTFEQEFSCGLTHFTIILPNKKDHQPAMSRPHWCNHCARAQHLTQRCEAKSLSCSSGFFFKVECLKSKCVYRPYTHINIYIYIHIYIYSKCRCMLMYVDVCWCMLMYVDLHERVFIDDPDLGRRNDQRPSGLLNGASESRRKVSSSVFELWSIPIGAGVYLLHQA